MKRILSLLSICFFLQLTGAEIQDWSTPPETISTLGVDASNPHNAMDLNGNIVAIWVENGAIISKNKLVGEDWSTATQLASSGGSAPQIVVDPSGNATAVWVQSGVIKACSQPLGSTWGTVKTLSSSGASSPQIAVNTATGDVVAVWVNAGIVKSSTKAFGGSWSLVADTLSATNSAAPQVAFGSGGKVIATWHTLNSVSNVYNVNQATKTGSLGTWSVAAMISDPSINSVFPQAAVDANGNIFAIWYTYNLQGNVYSNVVLQSAIMLSGSPWSTPADVSEPGRINPVNLTSKVVCNETGAIAVWTNSFDGATYVAETASTDADQQWISPKTLAKSLYTVDFGLTLNTQGDVFGLDMTYNDLTNYLFIEANETHIGGYLNGTWGNPTVISTGTINAYPEIAATTHGTHNYACALWLGFNGSNNVILCSFGTGNTITSPSNVAVTQTTNDMSVFTEYYNTITWDASSDPSLAGYALYRDGLYIAFINAGTLTFTDHNQLHNGPVTYGVSAIDTTGTESVIVSVTYP